MVLEFDIWGNVTKFNDNKGFWVKQSFIDEDITMYEDSDGNYWDKEILDINPFTEFHNDSEAFWAFNDSNSLKTKLFLIYDEKYDIMFISSTYYISAGLYGTYGRPFGFEFEKLSLFDKIINKIKNMFDFINIFKRKRKGIIDPQTGQINLRYNQLGYDQDFYL